MVKIIDEKMFSENDSDYRHKNDVLRNLQESKILLRHSNWHVAAIAFAMGFTEVTHFNNFLKKTYFSESYDVSESVTEISPTIS